MKHLSRYFRELVVEGCHRPIVKGRRFIRTPPDSQFLTRQWHVAFTLHSAQLLGNREMVRCGKPARIEIANLGAAIESDRWANSQQHALICQVNRPSWLLRIRKLPNWNP